MCIGAALIFQCTDPSLSDQSVYTHELELGDLAIDLVLNPSGPWSTTSPNPCR